jgi:hypothetical protein
MQRMFDSFKADDYAGRPELGDEADFFITPASRTVRNEHSMLPPQSREGAQPESAVDRSQPAAVEGATSTKQEDEVAKGATTRREDTPSILKQPEEIWGTPESKERQWKDEEDARAGLSKKDLLRRVEELAGEVARMKAQAPGTATEGKDNASAVESRVNEETLGLLIDEKDLLPEQDEIGTPNEDNIRVNKIIKAQNQAFKTLIDRDRQRDERVQEQETNKRALADLLTDACKQHATEQDKEGIRLRNKVIDAVQEEFAKRGYTKEKLPHKSAMEDLIYRKANEIALREAREHLTRKPKPDAPAPPTPTDTDKGGRPLEGQVRLPTSKGHTEDDILANVFARHGKRYR